jgi:nucleotide-binding universal stress UspA family protein
MTQGNVIAAGPYGSIVVGTDGSRSAGAAVHEAAKMARHWAASLHIVSAYRSGSESARRRARAKLPDRLDVDYAGDGFAEARAALEDHEEVAQRLGVTVERHTHHGDPVDGLVVVAGKVGADLIVVGNRGVDSKLRKVRPAICDRIEKAANCSVLVVDTQKYWDASPRYNGRRDSKWT